MKEISSNVVYRQMNWKYVSILVLVSLIFWSDQLVYAQSSSAIPADSSNTGADSSNAFFVTVLSVAVAVLAVLATIAIAIPTIMTFAQMRRVEKERGRFSEMADEAEKQVSETKMQIAALKESVRLYEPPPEILKKAKVKAEKISEYGDNALRSYINVFEEHLKKRLENLETSVVSGRSSQDEISATLNNIKNEVEKKPSTSEILVQVADKYKVPQDLTEIILQRVGLAFVCLRNLSDEERKEIMEVLSVKPRDVERKEE